MGQTPILNTKLPTWADPEEASVFDPLHTTLIRRAAELLGLNNPESALDAASPAALGTNVVSRVAKRVAPKKAVKEFARWLQGTSKKVANNIEPLSEDDAIRSALASSYVGGAPPPPVTLHAKAPFKGSRSLTQDPQVKQAYLDWARARKLQPKREAIPIRTDGRNGAAMTLREAAANRPTAPLELRANYGTDITPMTDKQMKHLIEGPKKAAKLGMITQEEAARRIAEGQAKIDAYQNQLAGVRSNAYHADMAQRVDDSVKAGPVKRATTPTEEAAKRNQRDAAIAADLAGGMSYTAAAKKHNLSYSVVGRAAAKANMQKRERYRLGGMSEPNAELLNLLRNPKGSQ